MSTTQFIGKGASSEPSWPSALLFACLAATAVVAPMLVRGNISGHDFRFHVQSWMDVAGQWRKGVLFPHWAEWANWGFGEPRFIFYPPLSWLIGAAIGSVLPWKMAPGVFVWIALTVAAMSMWCFTREWVPGPYARLSGALYALNPYHLVIVYYRSAFGELLAAAILPLMIWVALRIINGESRRLPILVISFAGLWLSNAPAAVISTYSLGIILLVGCVLRRSLRPVVSGLSGMAGGFALACFYILPAAWEQRWVQIRQVVADAYRPSVNFLFTRVNDPDFVAFNWKVSWVAVGLIVVTAIAVVCTMKHRERISRPWWTLAVLGLVATAFMLPPSGWLWRVLPKLWFVQFPWRWLDVIGVAFAFFAAAAIADLRRPGTRWVIAVALFAAIGAAGAQMLRQAPWDSGDLAQIAAWIRDGRGYEGTDEYAPVGCDRYELPGNPDDSQRPAEVSPNPAPRIAKLELDSRNVVPASDVRWHIDAWTSTLKLFTADTRQPVSLALRQLPYPGWNIEVDGQSVRPDWMPKTSQILVPIWKGSHRIQLRFGQTWDRTLGAAISLIAATTLGGLAWGYRRRALTDGL